jgi:hypothetical protein
VVELTREQVLGYRAAVLLSDEVMLAGVQDYPPGRTAGAAVRVRGADPDGVLVHSHRAAIHLHRAADLGLFAAALGALGTADLAKEQLGAFDWDLSRAMSQVAEAMRQVVANGKPRTKGELSTAVTQLVEPGLAPWCPGCAAHHVQDALFRYATLQAGLVIEVGSAEFHYVPAELPAADPAESQNTLVRRFLRLCGPCRPEDFARWMALRPAAARRLWKGLDLVEITIDGRKAWAHEEDLPALRAASPSRDVLLLPPYDPVTELADREFLVPDRTQRATVWRAVSSPGVLLVRGEIAGTWRKRALHPFGDLAAADRKTLAALLPG